MKKFAFAILIGVTSTMCAFGVKAEIPVNNTAWTGAIAAVRVIGNILEFGEEMNLKCNEKPSKKQCAEIWELNYKRSVYRSLEKIKDKKILVACVLLESDSANEEDIFTNIAALGNDGKIALKEFGEYLTRNKKNIIKQGNSKSLGRGLSSYKNSLERISLLLKEFSEWEEHIEALKK